MSSADEPLLPVEPERPSRLKLAVGLGAGAGVLLLAVVAFMVLRKDPSPEEGSAAARSESGGRPAKTDPARPRTQDNREGDGEERLAKQLYDRAESFERAEPGEYEKRIARWREVVTTYPTSSWARKADERHRAAAASLQAFLDREFESTRKNAQTLSAAGLHVDAIEAIQTYKAAQTRELLRRRADAEIATIENASRLAFNEAAAKAKDLAAKGDHAGAIAPFETMAADAIPEVASRCRTAVAQLKAAAAARARHVEERRGDNARRAIREQVAPRVLGHVRARQYDEALRELSAAAASPANAAVKEEIAAERASVADASSFWEAFLKTLKAKTGQEASVLLADGRRMTGKIARILPDRIVLEQGDAPLEAPFDQLHADLLVGWTLGRSLPAEDPVTYVKAALFFFCDGRDDLARLYLATARELRGPADSAEKSFREGFLRAAMALKK
jgi:hypothetical protein